MSVAVLVTSLSTAVIVEATVCCTGFVPRENVAVMAPPGTVTEAGTVTDGSLDDSVIIVPLAAEIDPNVTVPTELTPPVTCWGAIEIETNLARP